MNVHFRPAPGLGGLGCGCESARNRVALGAAESAPMPECQCEACAAKSDDQKRAVMSDILLLISIGTALYAILKGRS